MASSVRTARPQQSLAEELADAEGVMGAVYDVINEGQEAGTGLGQEVGLGAQATSGPTGRSTMPRVPRSTRDQGDVQSPPSIQLDLMEDEYDGQLVGGPGAGALDLCWYGTPASRGRRDVRAASDARPRAEDATKEWRCTSGYHSKHARVPPSFS